MKKRVIIPLNRQYRQAVRKQVRTGNRRRNTQAKAAVTQATIDQTVRQVKFDPRNIRMVDESLALSNQTREVIVQQGSESQEAQTVAIAFVSKALSRGFVAFSNTNSVPYMAMVYVYQVLSQFMSGGVPAVQKLPYWLLSLGRALMPKSAPFKQGAIAYKWVVQNPAAIALYQTLAGYGPYGYYWVVYPPSNSASPINGFPVADLTPPAYDPQQGQDAFAAITQFLLTNSNMLEKKLMEFRDCTAKTSLDDDVSTFALVTQPQGLGFGGIGTGGVGSLNVLEAKIRRPVLTLFGGRTTSDLDGVRYFNNSVQVAGDASYMTGCLMGWLTEKQWMTREPTAFVPVDFFEFFEVLSLWLSNLITNYANDPSGAVQFGDGVNPNLICPLTPQETALLLRAVIMGAFKDTQFMCQGIYPEIPSSGTDNQFVPFLAGSNTCAIETPDMLLPMGMIENIRALVGVCQSLYPTSTQSFIPILGQYATATIPSSTLYTWSAYSAESVLVGGPVYTAPTAVWMESKLNKEGVESFVPLLETPISLVDGAYSGGFAFINDPGRLKALSALWNEWLQSSGLQTYSMQVGSMGTEKGISTLKSCTLIRSWFYNPPTTSRSRTREQRILGHSYITARDQTKVDVRAKKRSKFAPNSVGPYDYNFVVADLCQSVIYSAPWEQVLGVWILPQVPIEGGVNRTTTTRVQQIFGLSYTEARTSGNAGLSQTSMHETYAARMVRGRSGVGNDWEDYFKTEAARGRGGILAGLLGSLVKSIVPSASSIVDSVADAVPF